MRAFIIAAIALAACKPPSSLSDAARQAVEDAYTAELLRCVEKSQTLEQSKSCRVTVNEAFGITETATKDGGQ